MDTEIAAVIAFAALILTGSGRPADTASKPNGERASLTDFRIKMVDQEDNILPDAYVETRATALLTNLTDGRLETAICIIAYDGDGLEVTRDWSYGMNLGLGKSDTDSIVRWPVKKKLWMQVKTLMIFATRHCAVGGYPSKDNDSPAFQMKIN